MLTCGSNFDTLPTCDYYHLSVVYPPFPYRYSNIEICKNSLPSISKHSLSQKSLIAIRLAHQKSLSLTPKNHSLPSFMKIEPRKTAPLFRLWQEDSLTSIVQCSSLHSRYLGFVCLRSCMQTKPRKIRIIAPLFSRCR